MVTVQELTTYYEHNIAKLTKWMDAKGSPSPSDHAQDVFTIALTNRAEIRNLDAYINKVAGNILKQTYRSKDYKTGKVEFDEEIHSPLEDTMQLFSTSMVGKIDRMIKELDGKTKKKKPRTKRKASKPYPLRPREA